MLKKVLLYFASIILVYFLQSYVLVNFRYYGIAPNLYLIYIVLIALQRGPYEGAIIGGLVGMIKDAADTYAFGYYILLGILLGYFVGILNRRVYKENIFIASGFIFICTVIYEWVVFFSKIAFSHDTDWFYVFRRIIFLEGLYNSFLTILIYFAVLKLTYILEEYDREARKY